MNNELFIAAGLAAFSPVIVLASTRGPRILAIAAALLPYLVLTTPFILSPRLPGYDSYYFMFPAFEYIGAAVAETSEFPQWFPTGGGVRAGFTQIPLFYFVPHRLVGYALHAFTSIGAVTAFKVQYVFGVLLLATGWWLVVEMMTGSRVAASFATLMLAMGGTGITFHQEQVLSTTYLVPWLLLAIRFLPRDRNLALALALAFGLAGTIHYPHILFFSFLVFAVTMLLAEPRGSVARILLFLKPQIVLVIGLFVIAVAPLVYLQASIGELSSPLRVGADAAMWAMTGEEYRDLSLRSMPGSSVLPTQYPHYLFPAFPPPADNASQFVGRAGVWLAACAPFLAWRKAWPVLAMGIVFVVLSLGVYLPFPLAEFLFNLWPEVMGSFRQWFHFFPMVNFCLSALAAIALAAAIARFRPLLGHAGPILLSAVFALLLFELAVFDLRYISTHTVDSRPLGIMSALRTEPRDRAITNPRTIYLQYEERMRANACCGQALSKQPYLTTKVIGGVERADEQLLLLEETVSQDSGAIISNIPASAFDKSESSDRNFDKAELKMTYRYDGVDLAVSVDKTAMLVMPLNFALDLLASVDGKPATVWRVNGAHSGVVVQPGDSRIEVRLAPDSYRWISVTQPVTVVLLFGFLVWSGVRIRRSTSTRHGAFGYRSNASGQSG